MSQIVKSTFRAKIIMMASVYLPVTNPRDTDSLLFHALNKFIRRKTLEAIDAFSLEKLKCINMELEKKIGELQ
jgi:hypothetical protein